jgi:hypothetical protein
MAVGAGRPTAAPQPVAGSASPCSAASDERSDAPAHPRANRYCDGPWRHRPASRAQCPRPSNRRPVALARSATVASDREERASSTARSEVARPRQAAAIPAVIGRTSGRTAAPNAAAAVTSRFAIARASFGRELSRAAAASPCSLQSAFCRRPRSSPQGRWRTPGRAAWRSPTLRFGRSTEPKQPPCHQEWKLSTQEWGPFRTLNWTLKAESRPQRARRAAKNVALKPPVSR